MRDGTLIPIKDMSDSHLINTIKMLRRNVERYKMTHLAIAMGEYYYHMSDEEFLLSHIDTYGDLINELMKRGLEL